MPEKKRYFKKEKKDLKLKRHKAPAGTVRVKQNTDSSQLRSNNKDSAQARSGKKEQVSVAKDSGQARMTTKLPKPQFPNIYRSITERFSKFKIDTFGSLINLPPLGWKKVQQRNLWMSGILIIALGCVVFFGWQFFVIWSQYQKVQSDQAKLQQQLQTWEGITQKYPTYRDAYFEAAVLAYRLGDRQKEAQYIQQTLSIDPNFAPAEGLKKL